MYFVNDKSDRSGFYFLEKAIIPKLRAMVKNREPKIFSERFSVEPSMEGGMIFRIKSRGLEKEFEISAIEAETLDGWLEYISKSLEDTEKLEKLVNIEEKSNTVLRECIIGMAKSQLINPDNDVYKFSVVSTAE